MVSGSCESAFASSIFTNQSSIFFHKYLQSVPVVFFFLHSEQLPHYRRELYDPFNRSCCIYRHLITGYHVHGQILDVKKGFSDGYPVVHPYKTRPRGIPEALKFKITSKHGFLKGERILNLAPLFPFNSSREPRADPAFMKKILKVKQFMILFLSSILRLSERLS